MKRWIILIAFVSITFSTLGCSMCCGPYDFDYPTFGGKHQRVDPAYGRVGSIFSDPNAGFGGPSSDSNLEPQPEVLVNSEDDDDPISDDGELERLRRKLDGESNDDLEPINPLKNDKEVLPSPDETNDTTASRIFRNRPLRSGQSWR